MKLDGERYMPVFQGTIRLEHYHRYYVAAEICVDKEVLDIASGEGFGSAVLAQNAKRVTGVDISELAVNHAKKAYGNDALEFLHGSATAIPLSDDSVDVVVSFETIEHIAEHDEMLMEICRVLRSDGVLILSSPNKTEYSDKPAYNNPFHVRELYTNELTALIGKYFKTFRHFGQRVSAASVIASETLTGAFKTYRHDETIPGVAYSIYDIVLASNGELPEISSSIFEEIDSPLQPRAVETALQQQNEVKSILDQIASFRADVGENFSQWADTTQYRQINEQLNNAVAHKEQELQLVKNDVAQKEQELQQVRQAFDSEIETLADSLRVSDAAASHYRHALRSIVAEANKVLIDKWWRRTKVLRRFSNWLRSLRGRPLKDLPVKFDEQSYLNFDASNVTVVDPRSTLAWIEPKSGREYQPEIETIEFSDISDDLVKFQEQPRLETSPRTIAFYLPQFHPFPENDLWWGKGFTEWTNVGKAKPLFEGHHQPHCPIHLGYYDLRLPEVMEEQARIARSYGVNGFAYYFYWFAGQILMNQPLETMLENPSVDMPFCFIWANENWTRRWDGMENDVLIGQEHSMEDSRALLQYLRKFFDDPRYITIDGKPVFLIYRPAIIPDMTKTLDMWREEARKMGFPGLYIICSQTFGHRDPRDFGFDASMEFPPHTAASGDISNAVRNLNRNFEGHIFDYNQAVGNAVTRPEEEYKLFPTAMLSWDNTARKGVRSHVYSNFSVKRYAQWLSSNAERIAKDNRYSDDEKLIFVNAWNEWAEGTHLEPDQKHGFGYLKATRDVLENYTTEAQPYLNPPFPTERRSNVALILHVHFIDVWPELVEAIGDLDESKIDIFATATSLVAAQSIKAEFPRAHVELVDNRGRDIRPFLYMFGKLQGLGYQAIAKVHGKKSSYRSDGDALRKSAYRALLSRETMEQFLRDEHNGLLAPAELLIPHTEKNMTFSGTLTRDISEEINVPFTDGVFPAGSMFWFRPKALAPLLKISIHDFDVERGLVDGTRAHAIERLFSTVCEHQGFSVKGFKQD